MDLQINEISSDRHLLDIEQHFRVSAGPGAGKTHWLIGHIINVLHRSKRLSKTRKIACITYTNIAVETIFNRLGTSAEIVEISTIHSFLYKHVIKPYISFIAADYELNFKKIDGHDDHVVSMKRVVSWLEEHPNKNLFTHPYTISQLTKLDNYKKALRNWLSSLHFTVGATNSIELKCNHSYAYYNEGPKRVYLAKKCINLLESSMISYKKQYWRDGILHHDDVLFFSFILISKFSFILDVIRAKFPYFFIDEFQDTSPIQAMILNAIGQSETIVGIIGDKAQSIYKFQGAVPSHFHSFSLPGLVDYVMRINRRSTNQIIDVLNYVRRGDLEQIKYLNIDGEQPKILIGSMTDALCQTINYCKDESVYSLSRTNIISNAMKNFADGRQLNSNIFEELIEKDAPSGSNKYRSRTIMSCIKAIEMSREGKFKDAIKEMSSIYRDVDKDTCRKAAIEHIQFLLKKYPEFSAKPLIELYEIVKRDVKPEISSLSGRGSIKAFYDSYSYQQFAFCVNIPEDSSFHKTIHKSKGDEFDNVLLILEKEADLDFLLRPNLNGTTDQNEEHRINYVAISRAKKRLFINVPTMSTPNISVLTNFFSIEQAKTNA